MKVGTEVEMSIGHRLMDYVGKCANPHGHNYRIVVEGEAETWAENSPAGVYGILVDFTEVKNGLAEILKKFDHAMILRVDDPLVDFLRKENSKVVVWQVNPTAENFARFLKEAMGILIPQLSWKVRVYETTKSYAEVR